MIEHVSMRLSCYCIMSDNHLGPRGGGLSCVRLAEGPPSGRICGVWVPIGLRNRRNLRAQPCDTSAPADKRRAIVCIHIFIS